MKHNITLLAGMCLSVLVALFTGCSDTRDSEREVAFKERLRHELRQPNDPLMIDFAKLAEFPWDRLHIFGPYLSEKRIEDISGVNVGGEKVRWLEDRDDASLLVFVNDEDKPTLILLEKEIMDFRMDFPFKEFSRNEAKLRVVRTETGHFHVNPP